MEELIEAAIKTQSSDAATRVKAEETLKKISFHAQALEIAKITLETSVEIAAQFHAALIIKQVLSRSQNMQEKKNWVQFLLHFTIERFSSLSHPTRGAIMQAIAVVLKLSWNSPGDTIKDDVMASMSNLMTAESLESRKLGLALVSSILNEFLFSNGTTSSLGLPMDFHSSCQISFQKTHLLPVFQKVLQCIHQTSNQKNAEFASLALSCAEKILCWDFTGNAIALLGNKNEVEQEKHAPSLPREWEPVILVPEVIRLFFQLADVYDKEGSIGTKAISCLVQISGIHGPVFSSPDSQFTFLTNFISSFQIFTKETLELVNSPSFGPDSSDRIFSTAQIAKQLFSQSTLLMIASCNGIQEVLHNLGHITLMCLKLRVEDVADSWFMDAINDLLHILACLVSKTSYLTPQEIQEYSSRHETKSFLILLSQISSEVVKGYIALRVTTEPTEEQSEDDFGETDIGLYGDQLLNIAILARLGVAEVLPVLNSILREKSALLANALGIPDRMNLCMALQEQIHWGILIAGHVMCDSADGETALIPNSILELSASNTNGEDFVVQLSSAIFGILDSSSYPMNTIQHQNSSPLLVETLFWFCERWITSYLFPSNASISLSLQQAYGINGNGRHILSFMLEQIDIQGTIWYNESDIINGIIFLLQAMSKVRDIRNTIVEMPKFGQIVNFFLRNITRLPASSHSVIIQTIISLVSHCSNPAGKAAFFKTICDSIENSFVSVIQKPSFLQNFQTTKIREKVVLALQMFGGMALSVDETNTIIIFETLARHFESFVKILDLYHSYPDVELYILTIFKDLVQNESFDALQESHYRTLYKAVQDLIQVFAKNEVGRHRGRSDDEDVYEDICVLFQLLAELISSEYEGFERDTIIERIRNSHHHVDVPQVVFVGINSLLPLVSLEMLQYPRLQTSYITLVSLLVDYFPDRLENLPPPLLNSLLESLMFGMNQSGGRTSDCSFKAVQSLGLYNWSLLIQGKATAATSQIMIPALQVLLNQTMQALIFNPLDPGILNDASLSIFVLTMCSPQALQEVFTTLFSKSQAMVERMKPLIQEFQATLEVQHEKQVQRLKEGMIEIGFGSPGLDRTPSLRQYRVLFAKVIMGCRAALLLK